MMSGLSQKNFLKANMAVAVAGLFVAGIGVKMAVAGHTAHNSKKHKMILQLNDPRWKHAMFVLGNAKNIFKGVGAKNIDLELVVFGPAPPPHSSGHTGCFFRLRSRNSPHLNKHAHIGG